MKLGYVIAYVADVPATVDFWERAFGLTRKFIAPGDQYAELDTGGTTLSFAAEDLIRSQDLSFRPHDAAEPPAATEIGLITEDVPAAVARALAAGAVSVKEPAVKPWGQTVAYVRDPNGILVEICTPMG